MLIYCSEKFQRFPDVNLPNRLFGETEFKDLPIIHIRVSKNNTIVSIVDGKGLLRGINSCGKEGYKNCRKGTNIAGQATAITLGKVVSFMSFKITPYLNSANEINSMLTINHLHCYDF